MSPVWVNGLVLASDSKKAEAWTPAPKKGKVFWKSCPDCGSAIYEMTSYWHMPDRFVCIGCYLPYYEMGIGFHDCACLEFPDSTLSQ